MEVFIDKSYDPKSVAKYNLSLKIGDDFFIADASKQKSSTHLAIAEKGFSSELKEGFQIGQFVNALKGSEVKISKKYSKVNISIANTQFSIVPKALFDKSKIAEYLNLNVAINKDFDLKFKTLEKEGIVICYGIPKELNDWIKKVFPTAKITHDMAVVVESVLRDFHSLSEDRLILNIHKGYFDLLFLKKGKLAFANSFIFGEKEDLLYYTLFTCEQLGIDPHEIETYLLGEIKKGSDNHQLLFGFIKNLYFGSKNKNIKIANGLNEIPNHYFYSVFNQELCV